MGNGEASGFFAEFILSEILRSLRSLRMTQSEGLRITRSEGFRKAGGCQETLI
jgi:hypothetical protein